MELQKWIDKGYEIIVDFGPKVLAAIAIWIIGSLIIKSLIKGIRKAMNNRNYDESLKKFLLNLTAWVLKIVLIIVVLGTVGVETTSFAAILAAAGLAIGLALQGSLGNFAGGVDSVRRVGHAKFRNSDLDTFCTNAALLLYVCDRVHSVFGRHRRYV